MHTHGHGGLAEMTTDEEKVALISYMLKHNREHTHELEHLAETLTENEAAYSLLNFAIDSYDKSNDILEAALDEMKKGVK